MNVRGVIWVGIDTPRYGDAVALFRDGLGLRVGFEEATTTELECLNGTRVQVTDAAVGGCPVPLFEVDDVAIIGDMHDDAEWEWIEIVGPDHHMYELASRKYRAAPRTNPSPVDRRASVDRWSAPSRPAPPWPQRTIPEFWGRRCHGEFAAGSRLRSKDGVVGS